MGSKVAVVTGASRGLGRSIAVHLARRGVSIVGTYHSREDAADAVMAEISAQGVRAAMLRLDAGEPADFATFATRLKVALKEKFERTDFDFLIHNAGMAAYAPFGKITEDQLDGLIAVHLKAPIFLTQSLLPMIVDEGRILNVSSGVTKHVLPGFAAYAAVKGAVEVLSVYMAKEFGIRKIRVNAIAPGAIETDFAGGAVRDNPDSNKMVAANTALGRAGKPDDIGGAVASILSDEFGWVNGALIPISGGASL